MVIFLLHGLKI